MKRFICALFGVLLLVSSAADARPRHSSTAAATVSNGSLQLFSSEAAAQAHCPRDTVVWLNTNSGIYHEKGMRWYGNTRAGAYVCKGEADGAGDRDTRNGQ